MAFQYACFISYRHGKGALLTKFRDDLYSALSDEIEALLGPDRVFLDQSGLNAGDFLDASLVTALCRSVCMVIAYSPCYFDRQHTYCAKEYKTMLELEKTRLELLPVDERRHGLIIPVAFRGANCLPPEFSSRLRFNFESYFISNDEDEHDGYRRDILTMADYVLQRCKALRGLPLDKVCPDPKDLRLPTDEEIRPWIESVTPQADIFDFPRQTEVK